MHYIFNLNNTITASRKPIDPSFAEEFRVFCLHNYVSVISGSFVQQIKSQLTPEIVNNLQFIFGSNANEVYHKDTAIFIAPMLYPKEDLILWLIDQVSKSAFNPEPDKGFGHIIIKPGCINFSVLGRDREESRVDYILYDLVYQERLNIATELVKIFPEFETYISGDLGIYIAPIGNNKFQINKYIKESKSFITNSSFPLEETSKDNVIVVRGWQDTREYLHNLK